MTIANRARVQSMTVAMIRNVKDWRENSFVQYSIRQAEEVTGFFAGDHSKYDAFIESYQERVEREIENDGHKVIWSDQQGVGVGSIFQGPCYNDRYHCTRQTIVDDAMQVCESQFFCDCVAYCNAELGKL
jgi:hypothetical protein